MRHRRPEIQRKRPDRWGFIRQQSAVEGDAEKSRQRLLVARGFHHADGVLAIRKSLNHQFAVAVDGEIKRIRRGLVGLAVHPDEEIARAVGTGEDGDVAALEIGGKLHARAAVITAQIIAVCEKPLAKHVNALDGTA